ncbi:membrane protein insertase YidC [Corynebacterium glucuronolyticum]|uniref:membrane protein insertase YidC n=1 Tax=Corynebacterium glucuronolyticum TaxID=39791 RepID=UPI00223C0079|nr:membrane protein insertase YidC [Corynebacterium glucuronolyticum]MCT1564456.1 membrane protein insertase YidC [Corynebacterium glucuronolyticum]
MDALVYLVSAVLKLWHTFLHGGLGVNENIAWILSFVGLIITVRSLIAPLAWKMYVSARRTAIMRPHMASLKEDYRGKLDKESQAELSRKSQQLMDEHEVNPMAGCAPMLIQFPVILGLYRMVLRIARPEGGLGTSPYPPVGFLSSADVGSFLETRAFGLPIAAYASMSEAQLNELGTTGDHLVHTITPIVIAATCFMTLNMILSTIRSFETMDWRSGFAVNMSFSMVFFAIYTPFMILTLAFNGPIPVAIIFYWFVNNFWTMSQLIVLWTMLTVRHPLTPEFKEFRDGARRKRYAPVTLLVKALWARLRGRDASDYVAERRALKDAAKLRKKEDKAFKKEKKRLKKEEAAAKKKKVSADSSAENPSAEAEGASAASSAEAGAVTGKASSAAAE